MKRTRRTLLATVAGSSALLAVDTLGQSQTTADRDVSVDVVSDADAYLSLVETEDGVETGGVLFEDDDPRTAPATFDLKNQLQESMTVTLEAEKFSFELAQESDRTLEDDSIELDSGTAVEVEVDLEKKSSGKTMDTIEIAADGGGATIEAERSLTLVPEPISFEFSLCRGENGPCTDVDLEVTRSTDNHAVDLTVRPSDPDEQTYTDRVSAGSETTIELEGLGPGKWTVQQTTPDPEGSGENSGSDESVTLETDGITVTIDPSVTGQPDNPGSGSDDSGSGPDNPSVTIAVSDV